ncbi:cysteine protease [Brevundimonas faecalis]|uniref:cysteine protease n=1 Tax=Brevundimonas faecalis TaxID=947378 RepID=UPI003606D5EE
MALPRLLTLLGGLLLSRRARGFAGRNAGKLALAGLALELWRAYQASRPSASPQPRGGRRRRSKPRWSGRRPR